MKAMILIIFFLFGFQVNAVIASTSSKQVEKKIEKIEEVSEIQDQQSEQRRRRRKTKRQRSGGCRGSSCIRTNNHKR